jgi:sulfur carrier protein ThiS
MKIKYQGEAVDTTAKTVAEFLSARGVDSAKAIVEYGGEVYAPGADLASLALKAEAPLDVFKLTAGG